MEHFIGLGVAGNFAGHLEQAGEEADFAKVKTVEAVQPKAIFPFYVPAENLGIISFYPPIRFQILRLISRVMLIICKLSLKWR